MAATLQILGTNLTRWSLVLVMLWIGGMKFTEYEANGIQPLVAHSPFMSWLYQVVSVTTFAALLGCIEIVVGLMIASRPLLPKVSAIGSLLAALMFVGTVSFILSTPGWEPSLGFPALSVVPGQFLLKDTVLLGAALWTAGEALGASEKRGF